MIEGAEDIVVQVNGDKEFKAKVIGADPLSDIADSYFIQKVGYENSIDNKS